ncbi:MAG: hypothetical protein RIQ33_2377 [Bacteroidota bacterium]|jgi:hypothetical protein
MKKAIYTLGLILMAFQFANAQCIPNANTGTHGYILPDSTQFPHGIKDSVFNAIIQIKVAHDTVTPLGTFVFDSIFITNVTTQPALPNGATIGYTCSAARCSFLGNSTNCIDMHVAATGLAAVGTYRIIVSATAKGTLQTLLGNIPNQSQNATIDWYKLIVDGAGAVSVLPKAISEHEISITAIQPNPAMDNINVELYSPIITPATLSIMNMVGQIIETKQLIFNKGINKNNIDVTKLTSGMYLLNIQTNEKTITQKIVVNH